MRINWTFWHSQAHIRTKCYHTTAISVTSLTIYGHLFFGMCAETCVVSNWDICSWFYAKMDNDRMKNTVLELRSYLMKGNCKGILHILTVTIFPVHLNLTSSWRVATRSLWPLPWRTSELRMRQSVTFDNRALSKLRIWQWFDNKLLSTHILYKMRGKTINIVVTTI